MTIVIPENVQYLMHRLQQAGYHAYAVGGCIRDTLLHQTPEDWDICTSALPQETLDTLQLPNIIENGLKHGTVTVRYHGENYEITTFRTDGSYTDNRRPSSVTFVTDVREDLRRRDFTINALAYNDTEGLLDCFGGAEDLQQKVIRCVGNPDERFQEDGLRIMRALRFASRFGFRIEEQTAAAIHRNKELLHHISAERINAELNKLLLGDSAEEILMTFPDVIAVFIPEIEPMIGFDQKNPHHAYDVWTHTVKVIAHTPKDKVLRLAALLHDIGKPNTFTVDEQGIGHFYGHPAESQRLAGIILKRLKYDNNTIQQVKQLVGLHDRYPALKAASVRRLLSETGDTLMPQLIRLQRADCQAKDVSAAEKADVYFDQLSALCDEIMKTSTAYTLKMLAVNGQDLKAIGIKNGKDIGRILQLLLEDVIDGTLPNEKELLLKKAKTLLAE